MSDKQHYLGHYAIAVKGYKSRPTSYTHALKINREVQNAIRHAIARVMSQNGMFNSDIEIADRVVSPTKELIIAGSDQPYTEIPKEMTY
jgi:hypothetical protein